MLTSSDQGIQYRKACGHFATGVTIILAEDESGHRVGLTANSFSSVSLDPPLVLWSLSKSAPSLSTFERVPRFSVNVLTAEQRALAQQFASGRADKFAEVVLRKEMSEFLRIEGTAAWFACERWAKYEGGDHLIYVGHVIHCTYRDLSPLVFFSSTYGSFMALPS